VVDVGKKRCGRRGVKSGGGCGRRGVVDVGKKS
jgi:hypothetical protein